MNHFNLIEILVQTFFALAISIFSLRKKSVSISGFISMIIISSFFIWNNGISALIILFSMFASASLLTKYKAVYKSELTQDVLKKHGPRDFIQAICNLGIAFFCFVIYKISNEQIWLLAMICSVASSNADSWASEIGVLSKSKPIMITNFKTCKPGISGGITLLGTFAGIVGSAFIALIALLLKENLQIQISSLNLFVLVTISGTAGLFLDSYLGATLQMIYKDEKGEETENDLAGISKSRGWSFINNDWVNFLSSLIVAIVVIWILN